MATRQEESTMAEILVEKLGVPAFYLANKVIIINVFDLQLFCHHNHDYHGKTYDLRRWCLCTGADKWLELQSIAARFVCLFLFFYQVCLFFCFFSTTFVCFFVRFFSGQVFVFLECEMLILSSNVNIQKFNQMSKHPKHMKIWFRTQLILCRPTRGIQSRYYCNDHKS